MSETPFYDTPRIMAHIQASLPPVLFAKYQRQLQKWFQNQVPKLVFDFKIKQILGDHLVGYHNLLMKAIISNSLLTGFKDSESSISDQSYQDHEMILSDEDNPEKAKKRFSSSKGQGPVIKIFMSPHEGKTQAYPLFRVERFPRGEIPVAHEPLPQPFQTEDLVYEEEKMHVEEKEDSQKTVVRLDTLSRKPKKQQTDMFQVVSNGMDLREYSVQKYYPMMTNYVTSKYQLNAPQRAKRAASYSFPNSNDKTIFLQHNRRMISAKVTEIAALNGMGVEDEQALAVFISDELTNVIDRLLTHVKAYCEDKLNIVWTQLNPCPPDLGEAQREEHEWNVFVSSFKYHTLRQFFFENSGVLGEDKLLQATIERIL